MTTTYEPTQLSINHQWMIDTEIKRLSAFKSITNSQRSTMTSTAEAYVTDTPPSSPPRDNEISVINESQEQDNEQVI